ncbi:MAG: hypothetical protein ABEJ28_00330 [Salinigranum sp.]
MTDDAPTRRRLLAALAAILAALLGAGFGTSRRFDPPDDGGRFDLSVDFDVDREDAPRPPPTPDGPTDGSGNRSDGDPSRPDGGSSAGDAGGATTLQSGTEERSAASDDDDSRWTPDSTPTPTAGDPSIAAATHPLTLSNLAPGDEGTVTATLSLSGAPARLWFRGDASSFEERTLTEPERRLGDDALTGELQSAVDVRLDYVDGGTTAAVYDGPITGLPSAWTALSERCFAPGSHTLRLRWAVDDDAPNTVQTDALTFSFGVAASSCAE